MADSPKGKNSPDKPAAGLRRRIDSGSWMDNKIVQYVSYGFATVLFLLVLMIFGGERFNWILNKIGLGWTDAKGVYADCSKQENSGNPSCVSREKARDAASWRDMRNAKGGSAFSLTGK